MSNEINGKRGLFAGPGGGKETKKQVVYSLVCSLTVTASAYGGFALAGRPTANYFGISEYAVGFPAFLLCIIFLFWVVIGLVVDLFLYPLVLRPFVSSAQYWAWAGSIMGVRVPVLSPVLESWSKTLYGSPHP
jgi:hypothetical protein